MKTIFILILISFNTWAYVPSPESLFRFSATTKSEGNYKSIIFSIEGDNKVEPRLYQLSFHQDKRYASKPTYITQKMYSGFEAKDSALLNTKHFNAFSVRSFKNRSREVVPVFLYSLLQGMFWHDGRFVLDALRNFQINLSTNRELINKDYAALLKDYKRYVKEQKEGVEDGAISPLAPTNPQDRVRLKATLRKGLIGASNQVRREFENGKFAFYIREGSFEAKFWEDSRELVWINFIIDNQKYQITFDDYLAFKGKYLFPQNITFITPDKVIKIKTRGIYAREESWMRFSNRKGEERQKLNSLNQTEAFPNILL